MLNPTFKRPLASLAVVVGLLASAAPASAAGVEAAPQTKSFLVDGPFSVRHHAAPVPQLDD